MATTGMRYSDLKALRKSNVVGDKINFTTQKTGDNLEIPLNDAAKEINLRREEVGYD